MEEEYDVESLSFGIQLYKESAEHNVFMLSKYRDALIFEEDTEVFEDTINYLKNDLKTMGIDNFQFDNPDYVLGLHHAYAMIVDSLNGELEVYKHD